MKQPAISFQYILVFSFLLFQLPSYSQFNISTAKAKKISIVYQNNKETDVANAANLLQTYLKEIFNAEFKISSEVTKKEFIKIESDSTLHPDGYIIDISNKNISIKGGNRKGSTYAAIYLLETYFGCKYLSPNFKIIPKASLITIPKGRYQDEPKNDVRIINLYYGEDQEFRDWHRLNSIEEVYPKGYFVHTFHRLLPWGNYFEEHPEYFALINGQRNIDQLCPSHPEVRNIIAQKLDAEMKLQPDKEKWSVSQNDNFSYCVCDLCKPIIEKEQSPAGPIIYLVNDMAKRFPDKTISTLAYQYSRKAPVEVQPEKNVEVMLCTIELYRDQSIEEKPESADFKKDMEDWGKICSNIFLWDYTINFNHSISPFPNLHVLQPNIQFFTKNNVNALFEQSNSTTGYEFSELKVHLLSKLIWNPNEDATLVTDQFLKAYYGEAAHFIYKYIHRMEEIVTQQEIKLWIYEHPVVHENDLFSQSLLKEFETYFDLAENAVKNDSIFLNHVQIARLPLQYAAMEIATNHMFSERGWYSVQTGKVVPNYKMFAMLDAFEETCKRNKIPTINEAKLSPEEYTSSLRRMINVNIEGNLAFEKKVKALALPDPQYLGGDLSYLTNGVSGASDYNVHWLGWNGKDTELILDLEKMTDADSISIGSLWNAKSWILHPAEISCSISIDGVHYISLGQIKVDGDQQTEPTIRNYQFVSKDHQYRFVKFNVIGTHKLFDWHPSAGQPSWFFLDEIVVK